MKNKNVVIKMVQYILVILCIFSPTLFAQNDYEIIECNTCVTYWQFKATATHNETGNYIVINLVTLRAKAFRVVPHHRYPKTKRIAFPLQIEGLEDTMSELKKIRDELNRNTQNANSTPSPGIGGETEINQFKKIKNNPINNISLNSPQTLSQYPEGANGCGTPSHATYEWIPDQPFVEACNTHDICFGLGLGFQYCNDQFLDDMLNTISIETAIFKAYSIGNVNLVIKVFDYVITELLTKQAQLYHYYGSEPTAYGVYCAEHPYSSECSSELDFENEGEFTGHLSNHTANGAGSITVIYSCEVWQFPDGNGGKYLLERNCVYQFVDTP